MILDHRGKPFTQKARADNGTPASAFPGNTPYLFPYDAANWTTQEMGDWLPWIRSPDSEINIHRDRIVGRARDLARNDGWASGGITRILDNTVGTNLRLCVTPDYRALAYRFGIKAFDSEWAEEFRRAAEALWRGYSDNIGRYNDVTRKLTIGQQFRLALRHKLIDGESLAAMYWLPDRVGYGAADYATSLLLIDPDRLSNPYMMIDMSHMRGGVEIGDLDEPVAYHIRNAEQNDWYRAIEANTWERIEREDEDGWQRVIHDFTPDRCNQHRGLGIFVPVISQMKMLSRYYGVELQAATIASIFGTYVTSPYDPALVQDAMAGDADEELPLYQSLRAEWAQERPAMLNGARVPTLAPGESINSVSSSHPHNNFKDFAHEMQGMFASVSGLAKEQITQDWSQSNYSNLRGALLEAYKTMGRRMSEFKTNFANLVYSNWLWEAMDLGDLPLPAGAPEFREARTAYSRCDWLGVARGWVDPVREKQGAILGIAAGISTLKREAADQGLDYEEVIDQRKIEIKLFKEAGMTLPDWAGSEKATEESALSEKPTA